MALERIQPPFAGIDSDSAPAYIKAGQAETSVNLLPGFKGKAPVRGGLVRSRLLSETADNKVVWTSANGALVNLGGLSVTMTLVAATLDSEVDDINTGGLRIYPQFVNVGPNVYGVAGAKNKIALWDGAVDVFSQVTYGSNTPDGGVSGVVYQGITHWLERLFLLKTSGVSGTPRYEQGTGGGGSSGAQAAGQVELHWSDTFDPSTALTANITAWQDDVSGLTNTLVLDSGSAPLKPVDLAAIGRSLGVLCDDRIILVSGTSPSNWTVSTGLKNIGVISECAHAPYEDGLIFVSYDGCYFFDGAQLVDLSETVKAHFEPGSYVKARVAALDTSYVMVTLLADVADVYTPTWAGICHVPSRSWTTFQTDVATADYPTDLVRSPFGPLIVTVNASSRHRIHLGDGLTIPSTSAGRDGYITALGGAADPTSFTPIVASTQSRVIRLTDPLSKAKLTRIAADYVQDGTAESGRGWQFEIVDPTGTVVHHTEDEDDTADSTSGMRRRHVADVNVETDEVKVVSTFTGNDSSDLRGELQDAYLEYQPAQHGSSF